MSAIKKQLQALLDMRKDTEPAGIIIGTGEDYMVFALSGGRGKEFPNFATEREAREALAAAGIKKAALLGH